MDPFQKSKYGLSLVQDGSSDNFDNSEIEFMSNRGRRHFDQTNRGQLQASAPLVMEEQQESDLSIDLNNINCDQDQSVCMQSQWISQQQQQELPNLSSPIIHQRLRPKCLNVAQSELSDRKRSEDIGMITHGFQEKGNPRYGAELTLQKQPQTAGATMNQNYVYSYSMNTRKKTKSQQLTQQQPQNLVSQLSQSVKMSHSNSNGRTTLEDRQMMYQRKPKIPFKTLEEFKQYQLSRKCNHSQVLVVDDNQFNILALQQQLSKFHLQVDMAFSGQSAIEFIRKRFDDNYTCCPTYLMIFMDIDMPIMNGYEATAHIQAILHEHQVSIYDCPVFACSAYVNPEDKQTAFESGMLDYITKPIMLGTLDKVLTHWFIFSPSQTLSECP